MNNAVILTGNSITEMSAEASETSCIRLASRELKHFANGEIFCQINENIRGKHVFIMQSTSAPVNKNLMELLIMIDTAKRSFADKITVICPHYGYARQDRQADVRTPITAKLVADMICKAGATDFITLDIHSTQIGGFFDIPFLNITGDVVFRQQLQTLVEKLKDVVVVSPDAGGMKRARKLAEYLNVKVAMIDKRRTGMNKAEAMHVVGDVTNKHAIIYDDMVDTAGTLMQGVDALKANGAQDIIACMSHGVLSGKAKQRIALNDNIKRLIITDAIPLVDTEDQPCWLTFKEKVTVLPIGSLIGKIIRMKVENESISHLLR